MALDYFRFTSANDFSVSHLTRNDGTLEYSLDATTWTDWNDTTAVSVSAGGILYVRGTNNTYFATSTSSGKYWTLTGTNIECHGNIQTLLDYATVGAGTEPAMADYCFFYFFYNCINLITAPDLPSMNLAASCYAYMFSSCTSLIDAPSLPAITLANKCYQQMFGGCTKLTTMPELPALTTTNNCYHGMFQGCTSLTTAKSLPATNVALMAYRAMFYGCTSLEYPPEIAAMTISYDYDGSYSDHLGFAEMFTNCTSLLTLPKIYITDFSEMHLFDGWVKNCQKIRMCKYSYDNFTLAWRLPAEGTATGATDSVLYFDFDTTGGPFADDPELNTTYYLWDYSAPASPGYNLTISGNGLTLCYTDTENNEYQISLTAEAQTITNVYKFYIEEESSLSNASGTYNGFGTSLYPYVLQSDATFTFTSFNLTEHLRFKATEGGKFSHQTNNNGTLEYSLDATTWTDWNDTSEINLEPGNYIFVRGTGNSHLMTSSSTRFWTLPAQVECYGDVRLLLDYATVEAGADPTTDEYCFRRLFYNTGILTAPSMPSTTLTTGCCQQMFFGCSHLKSMPELPATTLANYCYDQMFYNCTSLTDASKMTVNVTASYCCREMFYGCTALTSGPLLQATDLTTYCYQGMFYNCSELSILPIPDSEILTVESRSCYEMFYNCSKLPAVYNMNITTAAGYCFQSMYSGCTSITRASNITIGSVSSYCCYQMFYGCAALAEPCIITATTTSNYCYSNMFLRCTALKSLPELPAIRLNSCCYRYMFSGCASIKLSTTKTSNYTKEYRIPSSGTITYNSSGTTSMFNGTGGTFTGTPSINTTYYLWVDPVEITGLIRVIEN